MAIKITRENFEQKFGQGVPTGETKGIGNDISEAFKGGISQAKEGYNQAKNASNPLQLLEGGTKLAAGAFNTALSPLAPITKPINQGIEKAGVALGNSYSPKFNESLANIPDKDFERGLAPLEDIQNLSTIAGTVGGVGGVPKVGGAITDIVKSGVGKVSNATEKISGNLKNFSKDVIPNSERIVNHQVTKALDLTASDVKNISQSTGHEVGQFLAEKNLIKENKVATQQAVNDFFDQNYNAVRSEIQKVQKVYKPSQVPRYVETLKEIQKKVGNTPGLQKVGVEVENLLNKENIQLNDVQRVKEILDEHFNLYKKTGDVGEGVAKVGLDNLRKDLKIFIETEVKNNGGIDIGELNNNVATSKSISKAIEERSTAGLTRSNLKIGDLGIFGIGMATGGPLFGAALLFGKKLVESPSVQLRIAKFMDGISDAKKVKIQNELQKGKIPSEFNQFIKKKP